MKRWIESSQWLRLIVVMAAWSGTDLILADSAGDWEKMKLITPQQYVCGFTESPISVDGKIDESVWKSTPWTTAFRDIEGDVKPKPRHRTRAKMLWNKDFFYIAAQLDEPHVWGTLTDHDAVIFHDNDFEVFIDPNGDNHEYYELELNALNTTWDLFLPKPYKDGGKADNSWEIEGLQTAVNVQGSLNDASDQDSGWSVEIAIPWKVLAEFSRQPAPPRPGDKWRVNFSRVEWQHEVLKGKYQKVPKTRENNWVWSPQGIIDMHRPERWGYVQFSSKPPGEEAFATNGEPTARDALMEVYHRQRTFHREQKRWAKTMAELNLADQHPQLQVPIQIRLTEDGYQATLDLPVKQGTDQRWHVRQDSKLWLDQNQAPLEAGLGRAGGNRGELERALNDVPGEQLGAMRFLIANMPDRDLKSLTADFLLKNVRLAYQARQEFAFAKNVPEAIFFNDVVPYMSINERRDSWRSDFLKRFGPQVKDAKSLSEAAALLNQKIFPELKVRYSTARKRADQSPLQSIESGLASCTGLSVLLIDACRAVGVPARFVGTPLWSDRSGNHSWVEVWDDGWHFTGAAEPAGMNLDRAWFMGRASKAQRDHPWHAIYAVSFRKTPQRFPLVWDASIDYVSAVNVTDRYANVLPEPPEGSALAMFVVRERGTANRCSAKLRVIDDSDTEVFSATTNDERFDANDHIGTVLPLEKEFTVEVRKGDRVLKTQLKMQHRDSPYVFFIDDAAEVESPPTSDAQEEPTGETPQVDQPTSKTETGSTDQGVSVKEEPATRKQSGRQSLSKLKSFLAKPAADRGAISEQAFADVPLSRREAEIAKSLLWEAHVAQIRKDRADEMKSLEIKIGKLKMPFAFQRFGNPPASGRSLYISMHGGGGAPKRVNDQQWENQKRLYRLEEGIYVAPRAPTDTWNLWHQGHIDQFFERLIENMIVFENVNPDRVYIMGYSAGGDGVFQLAPRMADQLAAAAMMAGHPNETSPLGLRNLPFTIHMGELDAAYKRNEVARRWGEQLDELAKNDSAGYPHQVTLHKGKGHWMDRQDAVAIGWMAKYDRRTFPNSIVWKQDDVVHQRFYWLAIDPNDMRGRAEVRAKLDGQSFDVQSKDVDRLTLRLCDDLVDLDSPVSITTNAGTNGSESLFNGRVDRTIGTLAKTLAERGDPRMLFSGEVTVTMPKAE
ncbi:MAG: transglutaminase domain-containing protein [Rubripirellula sp.]|nr:transglutaminase domain-containing protein [Rubripirellula sp.]